MKRFFLFDVTDNWKQAVDDFTYREMTPAQRRREQRADRLAKLLVLVALAFAAWQLASAWHLSTMTPSECRAAGHKVEQVNGKPVCYLRARQA